MAEFTGHNSEPVTARRDPRRPAGSFPPLILWIPAALVAIAMLLPLAYLVVRTLDGGAEVWEVLFRIRTGAILFRSLLLVTIVTSLCIAIGVPLAWLTLKTDLPLRRILAVATALPLVIPSYVAGFLFSVALGPRGLLQEVLGPIGVSRLPDFYGLVGATFTLVLLSFPYVLLPVRAALSRMDPVLEEASRSLGRSTRATFFLVTLPLLRPSILTGGLLVSLYTLSDFGAVSLMRYETFTWAIFSQYESMVDRGVAAGLSLVLVLVAFSFIFIESSSRRNSKYFRISPGVAKPPVTIALGRLRWLAFVFVIIVVSLALLLPIGILGYWLTRSFSSTEPVSFVWSAMGNSLFISGITAISAAIVSIPIAILAVRYPGKLSTVIERSTFVGFALPGIVVALGIVFLSANYVTPIYQTLVLLVFAYIVLFLPGAIGISRGGLLQINPRVEEVARSLGRTRTNAFMTVTLPLMRRGIIGGAALVFLLTMKELPATLILSPTGFNTLATSIWSSANEAYFAQAAASSLLLILATAVPMAFLMLKTNR